MKCYNGCGTLFQNTDALTKITLGFYRTIWRCRTCKAYYVQIGSKTVLIKPNKDEMKRIKYFDARYGRQ